MSTLHFIAATYRAIIGAAVLSITVSAISIASYVHRGAALPKPSPELCRSFVYDPTLPIPSFRQACRIRLSSSPGEISLDRDRRLDLGRLAVAPDAKAGATAFSREARR